MLKRTGAPNQTRIRITIQRCQYLSIAKCNLASNIVSGEFAEWLKENSGYLSEGLQRHANVYKRVVIGLCVKIDSEPNQNFRAEFIDDEGFWLIKNFNPKTKGTIRGEYGALTCWAPGRGEIYGWTLWSIWKFCENVSPSENKQTKLYNRFKKNNVVIVLRVTL